MILSSWSANISSSDRACKFINKLINFIFTMNKNGLTIRMIIYYPYLWNTEFKAEFGSVVVVENRPE